MPSLGDQLAFGDDVGGGEAEALAARRAAHDGPLDLDRPAEQGGGPVDVTRRAELADPRR